MQYIHRRLALWDPAQGAGLPCLLEVRKDREWPEVTEEAPAWCLCLDDSTILRKVQAEVAVRLAGKPQQEQERLRRAYAFWGIPYNSKKAIDECECAERLGAFMDGKAGRIGVTVKRYLESLSLGLWILQSRFVSRKALQVFAGKEVHCLQFRRPLFSRLRSDVTTRAQACFGHCKRCKRCVFLRACHVNCLLGLGWLQDCFAQCKRCKKCVFLHACHVHSDAGLGWGGMGCVNIRCT